MSEVQANLNFGAFRQGKVYQVDESDQRIAALVGAGYLTPVKMGGQDDDRSDNGVDDAVPGGSVGVAEGEAADHISLPQAAVRKVRARVNRAAQSSGEGDGSAEGGGAAGPQDV